MNIPGWNQVTSPLSEISSSSSIHNTPILRSCTAAESRRPPFYHPSTAPIPQASLPYMISNPRPAKSPRHALPPDLSSIQECSGYEQRMGQTSGYQSQTSSSQQKEPREYFPQVQQWTTAEQTGAIYQTSMPPPPPPPQHHYAFLNEDHFVKSARQEMHYTWGNH